MAVRSCTGNRRGSCEVLLALEAKQASEWAACTTLGAHHGEAAVAPSHLEQLERHGRVGAAQRAQRTRQAQRVLEAQRNAAAHLRGPYRAREGGTGLCEGEAGLLDTISRRISAGQRRRSGDPVVAARAGAQGQPSIFDERLVSTATWQAQGRKLRFQKRHSQIPAALGNPTASGKRSSASNPMPLRCQTSSGDSGRTRLSTAWGRGGGWGRWEGGLESAQQAGLTANGGMRGCAQMSEQKVDDLAEE